VSQKQKYNSIMPNQYKEGKAQYVAKRRRKIKQLALDYKGNKCSICSYNKSIRALSFHHLNPDTKEFGIASSGETRSWERVKVELDKCILVCANCHMEIHENITIGL
jgi:predicted HNH restriction endonuclease